MGRASGRGCIDATTVGSLPRRTKTPKPPPAAASTPLIDELPPEGSVGSAAAHRPSRRTEIIDAAIRLFARKGFVDASISEVAEEAGVVVNAIYYHFASKEELFTAAVQSVFSSISAMVATSAQPTHRVTKRRSTRSSTLCGSGSTPTPTRQR